VKQIHEVLRVGFEPRTHGLEVQHPNHSATLPPNKKMSVMNSKGSTVIRQQPPSTATLEHNLRTTVDKKQL